MSRHPSMILILLAVSVAFTMSASGLALPQAEPDRVRVYVDEDDFILSGLRDQIGLQGAIVFRVQASSALGTIDRGSKVTVRLWDANGNDVASDTETFSPGMGSTVAVELNGVRHPGTYRIECVGTLFTVQPDLSRREKTVRVERTVTAKQDRHHLTIHFANAEKAPLAHSRILASGDRILGQGALGEMIGVLGGKKHCWQATIVGHTDSTGSDTYNLELAQQRARAVFDILSDKIRIVNQASTAVRTAGYREPVASNGTEEGRALNRRAEITLEAASCRE
ncbi:MAG TPA: OmpA family protein [Polyangium sp.]|nr:OmpA family protein [Polyangium sp.]